ncbi:redoxin domain-containing protein [Pseudohongiella spirulinae]|nr:redoxin domain-containing protein [Pseudohongiella spirulinae]
MASRAPDFALIDQNGRFHQLGRYVDKELVVVAAYQSGCARDDSVLRELASLQQRFRDAAVSFQVLVPDPDESRKSLKDLADRLGTDLPFLLDSSQLVADALSFTHCGEILVVDPARFDVLYRGGIGLYDDHPLQLALAATIPGLSSHLHYIVHSELRGEPFIQDVMPINGDPLQLAELRAARARSVSYEQDVAPILIERCLGCHSERGAAPWVMSGHQMVQGWSQMIRETLLTRRMPPGQIDYEHADRFDDVHHITDDEMSTLLAWIEKGARRNPEQPDPLVLAPSESSEWELGEPDMIVEFPAHEIPATGVLDYMFVPIELGLMEDKWVQAYEFDVDDKLSLHHIIVYTQDARQQRQNASRGGSRTNFGGYAPGREHVVLDDSTGILLKRDMRFMIQFHYTTVGRELTDRSRIGLYFRDSAPDYPLVRTAVMNGEFQIPPGVREFPVQAETVINEDSYLFSFAPHMHYRGKHIKFTLRYPDGSEDELLSIPNFQHNWQMVYRLRDPVFLPAGSRIVAEGAFDNSRFNPLNPDPTQTVGWGDQVWDEMFLTWMRISPADQPLLRN